MREYSMGTKESGMAKFKNKAAGSINNGANLGFNPINDEAMKVFLEFWRDDLNLCSTALAIW